MVQVALAYVPSLSLFARLCSSDRLSHLLSFSINSTGCEAYGYENMHQAAHLASKQVVEAEARFRMYGITAGKMRTVEADFCEDAEVQEVLKRATVVLVNNEVFVLHFASMLARNDSSERS